MQRLENLRLRVKKACESVGRDPSLITVLAVGKKHPASSIRELYSQGQRCFGENQLQEALAKQEQLHDLDIEWHFIGHLQSNKTGPVAEHFDWVQSVDRPKVLRRLSQQRPPDLSPLNICLEVNIDREPQKSGLMPEDTVGLAEQARDLSGISLRGLMAIPRPMDDPSDMRDSFRRVKSIYDELVSRGFTLDTLSMGMSADLEMAISEGSTMIRVGTDLFGPRPGN